MRIDDAAVDVMREQGLTYIWYGNPDALHEIADRAKCKRTHPLNVVATVMSQIARSDKFEFAGQIEHLGREYPVHKVIRHNTNYTDEARHSNKTK